MSDDGFSSAGAATADERSEQTARDIRPRPSVVRNAWIHACNTLQYFAPMLLAPLGGLVGMAYGDLRGALVGAVAGMLLAVLLMPLLRRVLYLGGTLPLRLAGALRRRPILTTALLLAALLAGLQLRESIG